MIKKSVRFVALMLIAIISVGVVGINILDYCCNTKEVSLLTVKDCCANKAATHGSLGETLHTSCGMDSSENLVLLGETDLDDCCDLSSECITNDYLAFTPIKLSDFAFVLYPPVAIEVELFNFMPLPDEEYNPDFVAFISPPHSFGRVVLAKHNTLLI